MKKNKEITSIIMYLLEKSKRKQIGKNPEAKGAKLLLIYVKTIIEITFLFFCFQIRNCGLYKNVPSVNGQVHERLLVVSV